MLLDKPCVGTYRPAEVLPLLITLISYLVAEVGTYFYLLVEVEVRASSITAANPKNKKPCCIISAVGVFEEAKFSGNS